MRRFNWLQNRKQLLIVLAAVGAAIALRPVLWPGGFGVQGGTSTTTTVEKVEKDKQGNDVKTVETTASQDGKTLWDWLSLLGVPLSLALLGVWFQQREKQRDAETAKEEALQVYFDRISTLLVEKNLRAIASKIYRDDVEGIERQPREAATDEQRELLDASMDVIRSRTLSMLRRFKDDRTLKSSVTRFLIEAEIINKLKLSLRGADLSAADLSAANLIGADLSGAGLSDVNLIGANLSAANLSHANLSHANLSRVNLSGATLSAAKLRGTDLSGADLSGATLSAAEMCAAKLRGADLRLANLSGANLIGAEMHGAKLGAADLSTADLCGVNLSGANLSEAEMRGVNLSGATLSGVNLRGANLSEANLSKANLSATKFDGSTIWPELAKISTAKNIPEELKKKLGISTNETSG